LAWSSEAVADPCYTGWVSALSDLTRWMDATDQAALVASGEVSPSELLHAAIERIERIDPAINAVVIRWFDHARETAASVDLPDGSFRGVVRGRQVSRTRLRPSPPDRQDLDTLQLAGVDARLSAAAGCRILMQGRSHDSKAAGAIASARA
jgi:hypothetical protein